MAQHRAEATKRGQQHVTASMHRYALSMHSTCQHSNRAPSRSCRTTLRLLRELPTCHTSPAAWTSTPIDRPPHQIPTFSPSGYSISGGDAPARRGRPGVTAKKACRCSAATTPSAGMTNCGREACPPHREPSPLIARPVGKSTWDWQWGRCWPPCRRPGGSWGRTAAGSPAAA